MLHMNIGLANAYGNDSNQHLVCTRGVQLQLFNGEWSTLLFNYSGSYTHTVVSLPEYLRGCFGDEHALVTGFGEINLCRLS
jgi:hypothetical protein